MDSKSINSPKSSVQFKMDPQDVENRKRLIDLKNEDIANLKAINTILLNHVEDLTEAFFNFLKPMPEAKLLFSNSTVIADAKRLKQEHIRALANGTYDVTYVEQRVALASLYSKTMLDHRLFLGAFNHLMEVASNYIVNEFKGSTKDALAHLASLRKVSIFDMSIISDYLMIDKERLIWQQQEAIRELSTPVLQLKERLLMLPIIGILDTHRARLLTENLLHAIRSTRSKVVVIDITGVAAVDSKVANHLVQTVAACKLMGAKVIVTGLSAEVAQTLVMLGADLLKLTTVGDLQGGIEEAERILGHQHSEAGKNENIKNLLSPMIE